MENASFTSLLVNVVFYTGIIAGVPLLVATGVGLIVSILQAITQIQDQTLSQTVKIFSIAFVMIAFGGALISPLFAVSTEIFNSFAFFGR